MIFWLFIHWTNCCATNTSFIRDE